MPISSQEQSAAAGVCPKGLLFVVWAAIAFAMGPTQVEAQVRGVDLGLGLTAFLYEPHERYPAVGGRLRLGPPDAPVEVALSGNVAFDPVYGAGWAEVGGTALRAPSSMGGQRWFWGAGYSVIQIDGGAGSGSAQGAHVLLGLGFGPGLCKPWSLEGRALILAGCRSSSMAPDPAMGRATVVAALRGVEPRPPEEQ